MRYAMLICAVLVFAALLNGLTTRRYGGTT
jgi:hypothetical protein